MLALLDGDIFCYRVGFASEEEPESIAIHRLNEYIETTLKEVEADTYKIFLTGKDNFRYSVYPEYKANRSDKPKPVHLPALRQFLVDTWAAEVVDGMEADDALAINQTDDSVICTIDKDLLQVKGLHYNFVKKEFQTINELDGLFKFYTQFLTGDKADNIIGLDRIGPVKAEAALSGCTNEQELFNKVRSMYNDDDKLLMNGRCLYMKRTIDDDWINKYNELVGR
jgi:DNA polymerase-1